MSDTYATFVSSQLDNTRMNKFMSRYYTSGMSTTGDMTCEFFRSFASFTNQSYSFVVETDLSGLKFLLDEATRNYMCQKYHNLRIIHVVNIMDYQPYAFGFGSQQPQKRDAYLVCSKSFGFLSSNTDFVEFSTYDMTQKCYTQLNRINMTDMQSHQYSFDFTDYHFERPVVPKTESQQNQSPNQSPNQSHKQPFVSHHNSGRVVKKTQVSPQTKTLTSGQLFSSVDK